jgi:hypothetical protein
VSLGRMFLALRRKMSPSSFTWQILDLLKVEGLKMKETCSLNKSVLKPRRNFETLMISDRDRRKLLNEKLGEHRSGFGLLEKKGISFTVGSQTPDFRVHSLVTITYPDFRVHSLVTITYQDFRVHSLVTITYPDFRVHSLVTTTYPDFRVQNLVTITYPDFRVHSLLTIT